ncbi:potassium channel subfamily K member 2 isoform X2 [Denticeps clupeoides]|nr:potassium channel subfamily K member 2-like isoform X2 [Denticeps clupeoides]
MRCSTLLVILTGVLLYLVLGALVFHTLETQNEENNHLVHVNASRQFLLRYACINETELDDLLKTMAASEGNFSSSWDLASAFFFSGTIITTIGYGNISPQTEWGKVFCIFYALVGIPMFGFLLAGVGDHLGTVLRKAIGKIEDLFLKWKVSATIVRVISALLSILLGLVLFVALPIAVFQRVENWSLIESAYFVVITLTTVGFGDYVPGDGGDAGSEYWYKPLVWFWILLGLAYFASILTMIGNWIRVLSKKTRAEMEELRAHATDWTQNIQNMSMDVRIPGKLDDPFKRRHRRRKHGHHSHSNSASATAGEGKVMQNGHVAGSQSETGSSSYTSSSSETDSGSEVTQTERIPQGRGEKDTEKVNIVIQPLDYLGENLAFIDDSSDAVSAKVHFDPLLDSTRPNAVPTRKTRSRRSQRRSHQKISPDKPNWKKNNGDIKSPTSAVK